MRVRFLGDGDHSECVVFGQTFPVGEAVEVEGLAEKLASNPMFEVVKGRPPKAAESASE